MTAEQLLIRLLSLQPELDGIPVSGDVPATRPERFVTVERTGGGMDAYGLLDRSMFAVQCWATSRDQAGSLAQTVVPLLYRCATHPAFGRITVESIANLPLDETQPRYQITVTMTVQTTQLSTQGE